MYLDEFDIAAKQAKESDGVWPTNRNLENIIKKAEQTINKSLALFPDDEHLRGLEAKLAEKLRDTPRALEVLQRSNEKSPHEEYIAIRYSRMLHGQKRYDDAKLIIRKCVDSNPNARRAKLDLAKALIHENNDANNDEIASLLRSGFSDGDTNYDTQFWYGRHQYLHGNRDKAADTFKSLTRIRKYRKPRGPILDRNGKEQEFTGSIKMKTDTYCFVSVSELNDSVYVHFQDSQQDDWEKIKFGTTVKLKVAFNFKGVVGTTIRIADVLKVDSVT